MYKHLFLGISIHGATVESYKLEAPQINNLFKRTFQGAINPFKRMRDTLSRLAIASGKHVDLAEMLNGTFATEGQFRIQYPNSDSDQFPPHTDTFSQSIYTPKNFERVFSIMSETYSVYIIFTLDTDLNVTSTSASTPPICPMTCIYFKFIVFFT